MSRCTICRGQCECAIRYNPCALVVLSIQCNPILFPLILYMHESNKCAWIKPKYSNKHSLNIWVSTCYSPFGIPSVSATWVIRASLSSVDDVTSGVWGVSRGMCLVSLVTHLVCLGVFSSFDVSISRLPWPLTPFGSLLSPNDIFLPLFLEVLASWRSSRNLA